MDSLFTFTLITAVVLLLPQKSYSSGSETISETVSEKSDPSKTPNPDHNEAADLQRYVAPLNQQSVRTALANLPVITRKNAITVLEKLIPLCGSGNLATIIISRIRWLLKHPQGARRTDEANEDEMEDTELQVRNLLGFDFDMPESIVSEVTEIPEPKTPRVTKPSPKKNKVARAGSIRDSSSKKSSDVEMKSMSV